MEQNTMLGLMALRDGFGSLRSIGGGPAGPQNALPMAMQYRQKQQEQEKLQQALAQAKQGGLPMGLNPQAFDALSSVDPRQALGMLTQGAKPANKPSSVQEYEYAKAQGFGGNYQEWVKAKAEAGRTQINNTNGGLGKAPAGYAWDNSDPSNPKLASIAGGPADRAKNPTEQSSKLALFGNMMERTMPIINGLEDKFDPSNVGDKLAASAGSMGEFFKSGSYQRYETAARAWAEGVLRIQTGAAATAPEIDRVFETYFAVPGNDPETIALKRQLRSDFASSLGVASGGIVNPNKGLDGSPSGSPLAPLQGMSDADLDAQIRRLQGQ